ncbi:hypothetical protein H6G74_06985 [Nostoc spongiaeforme FACHB-130]|uniref:Uncharacterized protein n=1 Tax=Nostoc spongiaeforme FACHB-130 TaxID=1357510 RepID=A0ABR8FVG4_9NOSO|nr:hypothetical protein [Nostoc spongiaeforme]MBD2594074.1 hypothetical protein [Nostoc spongiaeforme FACHB-130]
MSDNDSDKDKKQSWFVPVLIAVIGAISTIAVAVINQPDSYTPSNTSPSSRVFPTTSSIPSNSPNSARGDEFKPTVEYSLSEFSGAKLRLGNRKQEVLLVSDVTLQWDFSKCPRLEEPLTGLPLIEYRYTVNVTQNRGSKLLDRRTFKYASGDVDDFYVDIIYPGNGVYQIWLEFKYASFGSSDIKIYQTQKESISLCYR